MENARDNSRMVFYMPVSHADSGVVRGSALIYTPLFGIHRGLHSADTAKEDQDVTIVARNRKARHDYVIEDTFEAGIELRGAEVKSLRNQNCSIAEAYARPHGSELYLIGMHIPPYKQSTIETPDPQRPRKLLLHRREIDRIIARCTQRGYTLVPLKVYFRGGWAKVKLGLARSREHEDKRKKKLDQQRRKEIAREIQRRKRR